MVPLLLEGLESAWFPCSLILLLPGAAVVLASGERPVAALSGFGVAGLAAAWARFADRGGDWPDGVSAVALIAGAVVLLATVIRRSGVAESSRNRPGGPPRAGAALGGALVGMAAAGLWEPCVGEEFGSLLNELPGRGVDGPILLLAYLAGVLAPLVAVGALVELVPARVLDRARPVFAVLGGVVLATMAVATAAGFHDEVATRLIRWSL